LPDSCLVSEAESEDLLALESVRHPLKLSHFAMGLRGSLSMMQQLGCLRVADAISLRHIQVSFAVKPLRVLHADEWQAPTGISLTDTRPAS